MEQEKKSTFFKDYSNLMLTINTLSKSANNPFFKSGYVPLKDLLNEAKRVCLENNFIFYQRPDVILEEQVFKNVLKTTLHHKDGEKLEGCIEIVAKDNSDPQKVGAGITYMRRYSLTSMLNAQEEDDDGNMASKPKAVPKEPVNTTPPAQRNMDNTNAFDGEAVYVAEKPKEKVEGGFCPEEGCKGMIVKNMKNGNLFCSEKCWLKK